MQLCELAEELFTQLGLDHGAGQSLLGIAWGNVLARNMDKAEETVYEAEALFDIAKAVDVRDSGIASAVKAVVRADQQEWASAENEGAMALECFRKAVDPNRFLGVFQNILATRTQGGRNIENLVHIPATEQWLTWTWRRKVSMLLEQERGDLALNPVIRLKPNA